MAPQKKVVKAAMPINRPRKRTSQGTYDRPKNKHSRKNWKTYRGQG